MNLAPYILDKARTGYRMGNAEIIDEMVHDGLWCIFGNTHMGITAENVAEKYGIPARSRTSLRRGGARGKRLPR